MATSHHTKCLIQAAWLADGEFDDALRAIGSDRWSHRQDWTATTQAAYAAKVAADKAMHEAFAAERK